METSRFSFVPLLRSSARWERDFAINVSCLTALSIRRGARPVFQQNQLIRKVEIARESDTFRSEGGYGNTKATNRLFE